MKLEPGTLCYVELKNGTRLNIYVNVDGDHVTIIPQKYDRQVIHVRGSNLNNYIFGKLSISTHYEPPITKEATD